MSVLALRASRGLLMETRTWLQAERECLHMGDQHAVRFVGPDGSDKLILLDSDHACNKCPLPDPPPHEALGPIPASIMRQLRGDPRCGAPAKSTGRPCRLKVDEPGDLCSWHTGQQMSLEMG